MALFRKKKVVRRRRPRRVKRHLLTTEDRQQRVAARGRIVSKVEEWSHQMDIHPNRIAVRDQRSRWGSASSLGNVNFNWRIAFLPEEVFDYVIIHELAHLQEMNHSRQFWAIVERHSPHYRRHRAWLRKLGATTHASVV